MDHLVTRTARDTSAIYYEFDEPQTPASQMDHLVTERSRDTRAIYYEFDEPQTPASQVDHQVADRSRDTSTGPNGGDDAIIHDPGSDEAEDDNADVVEILGLAGRGPRCRSERHLWTDGGTRRRERDDEDDDRR